MISSRAGLGWCAWGRAKARPRRPRERRRPRNERIDERAYVGREKLALRIHDGNPVFRIDESRQHAHERPRRDELPHEQHRKPRNPEPLHRRLAKQPEIVL